MRLARQIRLVGLSKPKAGPFLTGIGFPVSFAIEVDRFARLYATVYADSVFRTTCQNALEENYRIFLESFSSEYNCRVLEEPVQPGSWERLYACTYNDANLPVFIDALLTNGIRASITLNLKPSSNGWLMGFAIASDSDIKHLMVASFKEIVEMPVRKLAFIQSGGIANPKFLTRLTLPLLPGIDEVPNLKVHLSSKHTFAQPDSILVGQIFHPSTGKGIVDAMLPVRSINQHVGILATTGAGKTNLCYQIVMELHKKGVPVLIFDWKRDYRSLKKLIGAEVYDFVGNNLFTFNPLKPVGEPSQWIKEVANIMAEVIGGGVYASGAFSIYIEILDHLYTEKGVYDGSTAHPTVFDLLASLETYSRRTDFSDRQRNWVASASKLLRSLAVGKTRDAFSVREGVSLDEILSKPVVIELDGLGDPKTKAFFISVLLQKIRNYRMQRRERDILRHVIVMEEAQNCLASGLEASSTVTTTYREIRSLCEGIISITQMPSELSKDALANTNTFFVMKLVHRDDKLLACNLLGIPPGDMGVIEGLDVGTCLMKTDDLCLVRVPWIEKPIVNDSDIRRILPGRETISTDFARRTDVENRAEDLTPREWLVLKALGESAAYNTTTLMGLLRASHTEISKLASTLINKGFVRYRMVKKKGAGRKQKVFFLFPYGEDAYRQKYGKYPDRARIELIRCLRTHSEMKAGVTRRIGRPPVLHDRFDLLFRTGDEQYAVEIETGSNNNQQLYTNVEKSVEEYGNAHFIVSCERMYYAVLQQCAKHHFDQKQDFTLKIAMYDDFTETGTWDEFNYA
jgi:DNA-binding MarR family transcriptional regulator